MAKYGNIFVKSLDDAKMIRDIFVKNDYTVQIKEFSSQLLTQKYVIYFNKVEDISERTVIEADDLKPCRVCGKPTKFIDYCYEARLCSKKCDAEYTDMLFPEDSKNEGEEYNED